MIFPLPFSFNELLVIVVVLLIVGGTPFARRLGRYFGLAVRRIFGDDNASPCARNRDETGSDDVCYRLLGLTPSATKDEIKAAYRRKAQLHHPDHKGDKEVMDAIRRAYEQLMRKPQ